MRRWLARIALLALASGSWPGPARADFISAPDVVVYCDPTLRPAMQSVGRVFRAQTGVPVRVLSAPGPLLLGLIARGTRDDVLVTQANWMDGAAARKLIDATTRAAPWRDRIVLAGHGVPASALPTPDSLSQALGGGKLGVIDPTQDGGPDGVALAAHLGWQAPLAGEIDGPGVAFVVATGAARLGLLPTTAALAQPGVSVVSPLPDDSAPPVAYVAAVSKNILSRNTAAFMAFLATAPALDALHAAGLETAP